MSLNVQVRASQRKHDMGRMTAVMRAATLNALPKVLRVAVVFEGRIVSERIFRDPRDLLASDSLLPTGLFAREDDTYWLRVPSGAVGRIVTREGVTNIGPHASRFVLDDSARGKITLGRSTVLFQFVVPEPRPGRPQLPLATQRAEIDWRLTVIVAFSFLLHFGFIGSMFSDWLDPVTPTDDAVVSIIDMTRALPSTLIEDAASTNPSTTPSNAAPTQTHVNNATPRHSEAASSDAHAASLAREAETMKMDLLSVFTGTTAVADALNRSDIPLTDLDRVARESRGVERTGGDLELTMGTNAVPDGTDLRRLGGTRVDPTGPGHEREVVGPKVDVSTPLDPPTGDGPQTDISGPIARLRPSYRSCYVRKGLSVNPAMEGKVTIEIRIAPNGDVTDVTRVDGAGLSSAVEQCIIERTHNASFNAPGGSGTRARVPIIFRQQP